MFVRRRSPVVESAPASQSNDGITSVLRLRRAPIVRASRPLQKYLVMLELNRPASGRGISREFGRLLQLDRRSQRWIPGANASTNGRRKPTTDPSDPFSPANPNDSLLPPPTNLPEQKEFVKAPDRSPQPTASPEPDADTPGTSASGTIPRGSEFQNQSVRQTPLSRPPRTAVHNSPLSRDWSSSGCWYSEVLVGSLPACWAWLSLATSASCWS